MTVSTHLSLAFNILNQIMKKSPLNRCGAAALAITATSSAWASTNYLVTLSGQSFTPSQVSLWPGDTVTFTNKSGFHDVVCQNPDPVCGERPNPQSQPWGFSYTYETVGVFPFRCTIHSSNFTSGMSGAVTVNAPPNVPPVLDQETFSPSGAFSFQVTGSPGYQQVVEMTVDLETWIPVFTNQTSQATFSYTNAPGTSKGAFLRVIQR